MAEKKRGLGRGLDQLLAPSDWLKRDDIQLFYCRVDQLQPNPYQPRQTIEDAQFEELIDSIQQKGVLQPILVMRTETAGRYQILAGERRWQAARRAGLTEVPVLLRETTSGEALELALIENIQRRDLNCIEEALAYQRLQQEFQLTQELIAQRVGKNRTTVANLLRLLQLPGEIQQEILDERITMGHARALLSLTDPQQQLRVRDLIVSRHLSVRQTEALIASKRSTNKPKPTLEPRLREIQETLQTHFGTRVSLRSKGKHGTISIPFGSEEDLQRLLQRLGITK